VARYAVATRRVVETGGREGWRLLREMCGDIVELRKGDHTAERLQIERERLELEKEKTKERIREKLEESPDGKRKNGITSETLAEIERMAKLL
jgi:hypothetical protein